MDVLLDPNVAYLVLIAGILLSLLALVTPGTGLFEVGAFFALALAGYAVYNLNINLWALIIILLSIVPFLLAVRTPKREWLLGLALVGLVVGSVFMFARENGSPAVNLGLSGVTSVLMTAFIWVAVRKAIQAALRRPSHDLGTLVGQLGEARTDVRNEGSVQVSGELWSARSDHPIPAGSHVRVVGRDGFVLVVEREKSSKT
ncbi:MAG: NfeD family protein [Bacteroidota bacterium]